PRWPRHPRRAGAARCRCRARSPCQPREGALHRLQLAQEMTEMLAVAAGTAALLHPVVLRQCERCLVEDAGHRLEPAVAQCCRINRDAAVNQAALAVIDREHLAGERPEMIDRGLR